HAGRAVVDTLEMAVDGGVDRGAVAHVGDVDDQLADVLQRAARLLDQDADVAAGPVGPRAGIARADEVALEILAGLALEEDIVAAGADRARVERLRAVARHVFADVALHRGAP